VSAASIYAEYEEVISRPRFQRHPDVIAGALGAIREKGIWVRPSQIVRVCSDPDDDAFLECAEAAGAAYLVTGNLKHFPPAWAGARIVTPRWLFDNLWQPNIFIPQRRLPRNELLQQAVALGIVHDLQQNPARP
jgi:predicted nucleic acid-binding protein